MCEKLLKNIKFPYLPRINVRIEGKKWVKKYKKQKTSKNG